MAKSTEEYKRMCQAAFEELDRKKKVAIDSYFDLDAATTPDLNSFDKISFGEFPGLHETFAVQYSSFIVGPIADFSVSERQEGNRLEIKRTLVDCISLDSVEDLQGLNLYTIVKHIGNGVYKDFVSGFSFSLPISSTSISELGTANSQGIKLGLLAEPLRMRATEVTARKEVLINDILVSSEEPIIDGLIPCLYELNPTIQARVFKETLPQREKIVSVLKGLEKEARRRVLNYYSDLSRELADFYDRDMVSHTDSFENQFESALVDEDVYAEYNGGRSR